MQNCRPSWLFWFMRPQFWRCSTNTNLLILGLVSETCTHHIVQDQLSHNFFTKIWITMHFQNKQRNGTGTYFPKYKYNFRLYMHFHETNRNWWSYCKLTFHDLHGINSIFIVSDMLAFPFFQKCYCLDSIYILSKSSHFYSFINANTSFSEIRSNNCARDGFKSQSRAKMLKFIPL